MIRRDSCIPEELSEKHQTPDVPYFFHTSGTSSGLPKPIAQSHAGVVGALPCFEDGERAATFSTTPLYHGGLADCLRAWTSGAMIWFFPEGLGPMTAASLIGAVASARAASPAPVKYFSSVPFVLQRLAEEDRGIELLRSMELVGVGGAPLPASVGDELVRAGVRLLSRMGSAECGFIMSSHRDYASDCEWQYLRPVDDARLLSFEPRDHGLCELVVKSGWPFKSKTNRDDGSYATSDLFEPHPSKPNVWRYHSRADAQIALVNGKKFDPSPMEADILASTKLLRDVLIFGSGKDYPGVLLFPAHGDLSSEELVEAVWPVIEKVNSATQSHARISRSMVVVPPSAPGAEEPLEKSSKGTIMRRRAERRHADAIENAYQGPRAVRQSSTQVKDEDLSSAVLDCFCRVLGRGVNADDDLYSQGVDSIACIQVRNMIEEICLPPLSERRLPANVIYDRGTVRELAAYLRRLRSGSRLAGHGSEDEGGSEDGAAYKAMYDLAEKYSNFGEALIAPARRETRGIVVVLTGATGFLGSYMLHQLRQDARVTGVYCLVRAESPPAARERVSAALASRGMPSLEQPCGSDSRKVTCLPCDLTDAHRLGLAESNWRRILEEATVVLHAAWTVHFSLRLESFESQVAGTRNLAGLAMESGARFFFLSSTAAVSCAAAATVAERASTDPSEASPLGYSRSKWVAERVCAAAGGVAGPRRCPVSIIRIGQLCGDEAGAWNASEAYPLMLATARIAACLPDLPGEVLDWMPVELAARAVLEIALPAGSTAAPDATGDQRRPAPRADAGTAVFHVLNPHAAPTWRQMLHWVSTADPPDGRQSRPFDVVPPGAWVARLEAAFAEAAAGHPAQALLPLWKGDLARRAGGEGGRDVGARPRPVFDVDLTRRVSATMRHVEPLDRQRVLAIWRWVCASIPGP